jgi:hypothetical protein
MFRCSAVHGIECRAGTDSQEMRLCRPLHVHEVVRGTANVDARTSSADTGAQLPHRCVYLQDSLRFELKSIILGCLLHLILRRCPHSLVQAKSTKILHHSQVYKREIIHIQLQVAMKLIRLSRRVPVST